MNNVIMAKFSKGVYSTTAKVFRYDVGDKLQFVGLDLPNSYRVDFSNSTMGESKTVFCDSDTVEIPPEYFIPGSTIYAWIVLTQENGRYTKYQVNIPISARAKPLDIEPTPAQQDALDEAIEALNDVTEDIQGDIDAALEEAKASGEFDGTTIWLYDGTPVLPDYTFYKYLMRANATAVVRQFDFILLGSVLYQIISVSDFTCKAIKFVDLKGDPGKSPIVSVKREDQDYSQILVNTDEGLEVYDIDNLLTVYFSLGDHWAIYEAPGFTKLGEALRHKCAVLAVVDLPPSEEYGGFRDEQASIIAPLTYWKSPKNESIADNEDLWEFEFKGKPDEIHTLRIYKNAGVNSKWQFEIYQDDGLTDAQTEQVKRIVMCFSGEFLGNYASKAAVDRITWVYRDSPEEDLEPLPEESKYVSNLDYIVIQDDETQNHECWRYVWSLENEGFIPQYRVNESPLTTAQLAALNSGITSELVAQIGQSGVPAGGTVGQVLFKGFGGDYVTVWGDIPKQVAIFDFTVDGNEADGPDFNVVENALYLGIASFAKIDFDGVKVYLPCTFYESAVAGHTFKIQFSAVVADSALYITITSGSTENTWTYYAWNITEEIGNSLTKYQGTDNAGKFLVVGADGNVITQAVEENNSLAAFATDTASGAIASFTDGADDIPIKVLTVAIEPVQVGSGDPSPSNVRPISGWTGVNMARTGKNLFDKTAPDVMHGYAVSATSGTLYTASSGIWSASGFMPVKGGNQYIISGDNAANDLAFYDANKVFISGTSDGSRAITAPANACYARMDYTITNEDRIQFEQSSAATAYEAYQGTNCAIPFPTEAGTVYIGTLDVTTGKLRSEWLMCDGGDLDWVKVSNSNFRNFYAQGPDVLFYANNVSSILSSAYKSTNNNASTASDDLYVLATALQPNNVISVKDTAKGSMTAEEFKAAMAGVQFLCKRRTPVEFELTPTVVRTILGANNIWADTGDSTVEYRADTKLYIDKKIAAIPSVPAASGVSF